MSASLAPGVVVDRRLRPHRGPRERRTGADRRRQQIAVAVDRRGGEDRRVSDRSRAQLWRRRAVG